MTHDLIDVRCPNCGYSPLQEAINCQDMQPHDPRFCSMPTCQDDITDAFEVCGCEEGEIQCPVCQTEFATRPDPDKRRKHEPLPNQMELFT